MSNAKPTRTSADTTSWAQRDDVADALIEATTAEVERRSDYEESPDAVVELAKRLAKALDTSPFNMWNEAESGELGEEFYILAPDMARSARAHRLAVAIGVAASSGMPTSSRILVLTQWCGVVLPALASDPCASVLRETIELARTVAAAADPDAIPGLVDTLADLDHRNSNSSPLHSLNDWARHQLEFVVYPEAANTAACALGYEAWWRATDILGSIEKALGDEAETAFVECERILGEHVYMWRSAPSNALLKLPAMAMATHGESARDDAESYPEHAALYSYLRGALAEAGGNESGERRVLLAGAEAMLEAQLADITDSYKRRLTLLREARLDGRDLPAVVGAYQRLMADRDDSCSSEPSADPATCACTKCASERTYSARFSTAYEAEYVFNHAVDTRPAVERLKAMIDAVDSTTPFAAVSERTFAAALAALTGKKAG